MKLTASITLFFILTAVVSCKKQDDNANPCPPDCPQNIIPSTDYLPLDSGNYWIYDRYTIDTNGVITGSVVQDTDFVMTDTVINDINYHRIFSRMVWGLPLTITMKDSSGYLVDDRGHIFMSTRNFGDITVDDTLYGRITTSQSVQVKNPILVPAGSFQQIIDRKRTTVWEDAPENWMKHRVGHVNYSKDIGLISQTWYYMQLPTTTVRELREYHVQ